MVKWVSFRFNYRLATIAYNIGPNKLRNLLNEEDIDTDNFSYFLKVEESYNDLTKNYSKQLNKRLRPFEMTYVVRGQGRILEEHLLKLYTIALPSVMTDLLISSENLASLSSNTSAF